MNKNLGLGSLSGSLLAILLAGGSLTACTTTAVKSDGGTGGRGGSGGSTGTGGGAGTGTGGSTGSGGADGGYAISDGVMCPPPAQALLTDFNYAAVDGGVAGTTVRFGGDSTTFAGGAFVYPNDPALSTYVLTSDVSANNWHVTGTVGDYSGLGLYFDNCGHVDASAYRGISFNISGTVAGGTVTFEVDTLKDTIAASWLNTHAGSATEGAPGHCIPNAAAINQYVQTDCVQPTKAITVPTTAGTTPVTVLWSDFTTGKPQPAVTPADIIGIRWVLPVPAGAGTATVTTYPLDIVIDDLTFVQ